MNSLTEFVKNMEHFLNSKQPLLVEADEELITPKTIKLREELIRTITSMLAIIQSTYDKLDAVNTDAKRIHNRDLYALDKMLNQSKLTNVTRTSAVTLAALSIQPHARSYADAALVEQNQPDNKADAKITSGTGIPNGPSTTNGAPNSKMGKEIHKYTNIELTKQLSLPAIKVATFAQVRQNGELYYVDQAGHFALKLCGHILHGNIGNVYTDEKNPEKIKDCKFANACIKRNKCDYYHDPIKFDGSKDCRNFIANSFIYSPHEGYYKTKTLSRRFGSRKYLDEDIAVLPDEEATRFHDQAMHDLLCSLLLHSHLR
jgi:hypothetical protein